MAAATLYNDLNSNRSLRLQTLVRLRWLAVGGQSLAVVVTALWLQFPLPVVPCSVLIACLALLNVFLTLRFPPTQRLTPPAAFTLLGIDLAQLTALLFITGGLANPFAPLLCVPVIISSASQPKPQSIVLAGLAVLGVTALAFSPFPLPWYPGTLLLMPRVLTAGIWFAIVSMTAFAAFYTYRVSLEASELSEALTATELVLQREKHLSQLDGLAAAAAHELGTPLATISVVAKEMERELGDDPRRRGRPSSAQPERTLPRHSEAADHPFVRKRGTYAASAALIADRGGNGATSRIRHRNRAEGAGRSRLGTGRHPQCRHSLRLGNLLENAVDYARKKVTVTTEHTAERVRVTIEDDGDGFSPDILARIGEPYVTRRQKDDSAGGLGLGLFIAKTLLERSGARLRFENGGSKHPGARVSVEWPRVLMDTKLAK